MVFLKQKKKKRISRDETERNNKKTRGDRSSDRGAGQGGEVGEREDDDRRVPTVDGYVGRGMKLYDKERVTPPFPLRQFLAADHPSTVTTACRLMAVPLFDARPLVRPIAQRDFYH